MHLRIFKYYVRPALCPNFNFVSFQKNNSILEDLSNKYVFKNSSKNCSMSVSNKLMISKEELKLKLRSDIILKYQVGKNAHFSKPKLVMTKITERKSRIWPNSKCENRKNHMFQQYRNPVSSKIIIVRSA